MTVPPWGARDLAHDRRDVSGAARRLRLGMGRPIELECRPADAPT
jgi:hypothetical protein